MTTRQKELYESQAFLDAVEIEQEAWRLAQDDHFPTTFKSECLKGDFCPWGKHHIECPKFHDQSGDVI